MYQQQAHIHVEKGTSPVTPNFTYSTNLNNAVGYIGSALVDDIQKKSNNNPVRIATFQILSNNRFYNPVFQELYELTCLICEYKALEDHKDPIMVVELVVPQVVKAFISSIWYQYFSDHRVPQDVADNLKDEYERYRKFNELLETKRRSNSRGVPMNNSYPQQPYMYPQGNQPYPPQQGYPNYPPPPMYPQMQQNYQPYPPQQGYNGYPQQNYAPPAPPQSYGGYPQGYPQGQGPAIGRFAQPQQPQQPQQQAQYGGYPPPRDNFPKDMGGRFRNGNNGAQGDQDNIPEAWKKFTENKQTTQQAQPQKSAEEVFKAQQQYSKVDRHFNRDDDVPPVPGVKGVETFSSTSAANKLESQYENALFANPGIEVHSSTLDDFKNDAVDFHTKPTINNNHSDKDIVHDSVVGEKETVFFPNNSQPYSIIYSPLEFKCIVENNEAGDPIQKFKRLNMNEQDHILDNFIVEEIKFGDKPSKEDIDKAKKLEDTLLLDDEKLKEAELKAREANKKTNLYPEVQVNEIANDSLEETAIAAEVLSAKSDKEIITIPGYLTHAVIDNKDLTSEIEKFASTDNLESIVTLIEELDKSNPKLARSIDKIYTDLINDILEELGGTFYIEAVIIDGLNLIKRLEKDNILEAFERTSRRRLKSIIKSKNSSDKKFEFSTPKVEGIVVNRVYTPISATRLLIHSKVIGLRSNVGTQATDELTSPMLVALCEKLFRSSDKVYHYVITKDQLIFKVSQSGYNKERYLFKYMATY